MATKARTTPAPQLHRDGLKLPTHVGIIMDGNSRWAARLNLPRLAGHEAGVRNVRRTLETLVQRGVKYVTLYAFSTENWNRPTEEIQGIMALLEHVIQAETQGLHKQGVRILHLGRTDRLSPSLRDAVARAQELTRDNTRATLCVAFDYGGRAEILEAVRRLLAKGIAPAELDEELFSRNLYTAGLPDPDLVVRTGGELRLSNFLLWQSAYSEYYATKTLWPDFDDAEIAKALEAYGHRQRRFGARNHED
ncbi:MAG: polyprenyl diphosphate synthase [Chloroflexota bacterium]|nr:polyprenyl diphosphate synthase [Chloroflexota bacterium]